MKKGMMLYGHGSRDPAAVAAFEALAAALRVRAGETALAAGYLEFAPPTIRERLETLAARGVTRILAVPAMLFAETPFGRDDIARLGRRGGSALAAAAVNALILGDAA